MNKSIFLQIFVFAIIVAFMGSLNTYAQDVSTGKIPQRYVDKLQGQTLPETKANVQNDFGDMLASLGFAHGAQTGLMHDIQLPSGTLGNMGAGPTGGGYVSGMTRDPSLAPNSYWLVDVNDSVWQFDENTGVATYFGSFTVPVGANGWAFNPVDGMFYLTDGANLWMLPVLTPGPTMTPTLIGPHVASTLMIDLCFAFDGTCYGYDIATDAAYTISFATGAATLIGPLGYNANFGQGMGYDYETGWIYLTAFDFTAFDGQLRVMDPETGFTNVLASFGVNQKDPFSPQTNPLLPLPGPGRATAPTPVNGESAAIGVPSITLSWTNPGGATTTEVFFGTDPNALTSIQSGTLATSVSVTVDYSTTYYWYVNEISGATTKGTLWSFTTEALILPSVPLPVIADFEDGIFPPTGWTQNGVIWFNDNTVSGYGNGTWSAYADFYSTPSGFDDLVTVEYISTGAANPTLTFDWAYATYPGAVDHLEIYYSIDQGTTWILLADMYDAAPGDDNLNPFNLSQTAPYYPPGDDEWSTRSIDLPPNTTHVSFTAVTDYGNLLWVDNIAISAEKFEDSFESPDYTFPGQVACQQPTLWTVWSGVPCGNDDATISTNYAYTGTQSALIDYVPPRDVDLVKDLGAKTSGKWYISFFMYIPTGKAGYFNTLAVVPPLQDWGMEVYFNAGGGGELANVPGAPINFTWAENTWSQVLVVVDLDQSPSEAEFWFGKVGQLAQLHTWDWTQGGLVTDALGGNDFFGATLDDEMYIDDYYFSDVPPPIQQLADDVGTFSIDMAFQYAPGTITPLATVKNYGTADHSFDVLMTITGGYSQTVTTPTVLSGETYQVTFPDWTETTVGSYTVDVTTQLVGDGNSDNDNLSKGLHIWDDSGDWTSGTDYPITTYNGTGVSYNDGTDNWLFVMGGNTTSGLRTECFKYNVTTGGAWIPIAPLPSGRLIHAAAAVGDYIYVIGGSDGTVYTNTTYKYDIALDTWTLITAVVPTTIGWCRAVSYMDQYIYVGGGYDGVANYLNTVYLFDAVTETYSVASPMPLEVFGGGFGITGNTLVYAAGAYLSGISNTVMVGTIDGGNPAVINWTVAENTYPGIGKPVSGDYGASLVAEMLSQSTGLANNHSPDAIVWPAGAIYRTHAHTWGSDAIIMAGGTPTSNYIAADPGPAYIYKPGTDTWVAQENVPVPVGAHQSGTVNDGSTWKYIIASGFGVDSTESETQIYTQSLGGATFTLNVTVADGWNMVSVPGTNPAGMAPVNWWSNVVGSVFKFSGGYVPVTTTAPTEGYWMKNNGAETYNYPAIGIVTHTSIAAAAGWNLIGGYELTVPVGTLTTTPSGLLQLPIFEYSGGYIVATNIVPGYAYWAKMSAAGLIDAPPLAKGSADVVEYFKEDWGKIILTDAAGTSYTLYAVQGEVDLNNYDLPPAPPAGMFDIRFGSGRIAEDLTSSQSIELNSVQYPLSVRVENMTLTLQDPSGVAVNASINPGEEVTINSSINKLIVLSDGLSIPIEYALEQNYPNPFNPSTTIKFSLPEATDVSLNIYNTLGEKIAQIVNSKLEAGRYSYQWDAGNIATGMYIYELRTDNFVSVKKMILLK